MEEAVGFPAPAAAPSRSRVPHPTIAIIAITLALIVVAPPSERRPAAAESAISAGSIPAGASAKTVPAAAPSAAPLPLSVRPDQVVIPPAEFPLQGWRVADDRALTERGTDPAWWRRRFVPQASTDHTSVTVDVGVTAEGRSFPPVDCARGLTGDAVGADFSTPPPASRQEVRGSEWPSVQFRGRGASAVMCRLTWAQGTVYLLHVLSPNVAIDVVLQTKPVPSGATCCGPAESAALRDAADVGLAQLQIVRRVLQP